MFFFRKGARDDGNRMSSRVIAVEDSPEVEPPKEVDVYDEEEGAPLSKVPPAHGVARQKQWVQRWLSSEASHDDMEKILQALAEQREAELDEFINSQAMSMDSMRSMSTRVSIVDGSGSMSVTPTAGKLQLSASVCYDASEGAAIDVGDTPILQFSCGKYFCAEEEPHVGIDVIRVGPVNKASSVQYRTKDRTGTAGVVYVKTEGTIRWEAGEVDKTIEVKLLDDNEWSGVLEFSVELLEEGIENGILSMSAKEARVQRIEDDVYPAKRHEELILKGRVADADSKLLMIDFVRSTLSDPVVRLGSTKMFLSMQLINTFTIFKLCASAYMVDHILVPSKDIQYKLFMLVVMQGLLLIPQAITHFLTYRKTTWRVGKARVRLTNGLVNAFMYMEDAARLQVNVGELTDCITKDVEDLLKGAYNNIFIVSGIIGRIVLCLAFQIGTSCLAASQSPQTALLGSLPMLSFPLIMVFTIWLRAGVTVDVAKKENAKNMQLTKSVHDVVGNFRLITDFGLRQKLMDAHVKRVEELDDEDKAAGQVLFTSQCIMKWLTLLAVAAYMVIGGVEVIKGGMRLGVFLTCLGNFKAVGALWGQMYIHLFVVVTKVPALCRVVTMINAPSSARLRMEWSRHQHKITRNLCEQMLQNDPSLRDVPLLDKTPILMQNIGVSLRTHDGDGSPASRKTEMHFDNLEIPQGVLVSLVGKRGQGKSTLLRILGGAVLPEWRGHEESVFLVPSHLRVLHVPQEALFVKGSLYDNLTFGLRKGDPDGSEERVRKICRRLGLPSKLVHSIKEGEDEHHTSWSETLSGSEQHMLAFARALITNPEVLCIHKPTLHMNDKSSHIVVDMLREFVDERGVCLSPETKKLRRPRTCIITSARTASMWKSDKVFKVQGWAGGNQRPGSPAGLNESFGSNASEKASQSIEEIPPELVTMHDPDS